MVIYFYLRKRAEINYARKTLYQRVHYLEVPLYTLTVLIIYCVVRLIVLLLRLEVLRKISLNVLAILISVTSV